MKTGWKIVGHNADLQVAMFRADNENEPLESYDDAKQLALDQLRNHVAPYLEKIGDLESDAFRASNALPPMRAWQSRYGKKLIVTAKSKKRAMELVQESRYGFESDWSECDGFWWYQLAHEESVWKEERDIRGLGNGKFHQYLRRDEADAILQAHIARYREVHINELLHRLNDDRVFTDWIDTGVSYAGTPYEIKTNIWLNPLNHSALNIECRIDDGFGVNWHPPALIERKLPQFEVADKISWRTEGF